MDKREKQDSTLHALMNQAFEILDAKAHDYAKDDDRLSNFKFVGMVLDWAVNSGVRGADLSYLALISVKLARLIELRGHDKETKNEAITDSCVDGANYFLLWGTHIETES